MRRIALLTALICLICAFSTNAAPKENLDQVIMKGLTAEPYPWAINEPQMVVRLTRDGYQARNAQGVIRGGSWLYSNLGKFERSLESVLGQQEMYSTRGKAVLVHLAGPFTLAFFVSRHQGGNYGTIVAIEVPGKVNLETLNEIGNANFPEFWKNLDPIEVVKTEDAIPPRPHANSTTACEKMLTSCSVDDLVCELESRG